MRHDISTSREHTLGHHVRVTLVCTCGKHVHSKRGWDGAYQAFWKHQRRAAEKEAGQ